MVRISDAQVRSLLDGVRLSFGEGAKVWVFGSRADYSARGGDVDLYIETDLIKGVVQAKLDLRSFLWESFGDQKIDILIRSRSKPMSPMHEIAKDSGVQLSE